MLATRTTTRIYGIYKGMVRISPNNGRPDICDNIAETCALPMKTGNDDITTFLRPLKVYRNWSYQDS